MSTAKLKDGVVAILQDQQGRYLIIKRGAGVAVDVELELYDVTGRAVAVLARRPYAAGSHEVRWPGTDTSGRQLAAGAYFLRIQAGPYAATQRILLAR